MADCSHTPIILQKMPQQADVFCRRDDWTGTTDPAKRRRLQSRLYMRTRRKRQMTCKPLSQNRLAQLSQITVITSRDNSCLNPSDLRRLFDGMLGVITFSAHERADAVQICRSTTDMQLEALSHLRDWAYSNYLRRLLNTNQLLVLVKLNVFRALLRNSEILGFPTEQHMTDEAVSPLLGPAAEFDKPGALPPTLRTIGIQQRVPHHPWIDLLPIPRMRENLISAGDTLDELELCGDLVGMFSKSDSDAGMVVWGESWDISGWEITEAFVKRWGWTVKGCWDLFESTNRWRRRRNEEPLRFRGLE